MLFYILLGLIAFPIVVGAWFSTPAYKGPITDHFDGKKFYNPWDLEGTKGLTEVMKWGFSRDQGKWTKNYEDIQTQMPAAKADDITITMINHSTVLLQGDGKNILFDPIWSQRSSPVSFAGPERQLLPGIKFEDLPPINLVFYSHNHYDHLDVPTLQRIIEEHNPTFIVPLGVDLFLKKYGAKNIIALDWWEETKQENLIIHAIPARHFSGRGLFDRDKSLWAGFTLQFAGGRVYFAGDTGYAPVFKEIPERIGPIKVALVPVGAYKPRWFMSPVHTDPAEGVQIFEDVKAEYGIPIHFGTFPLADEGQGEAETELRKVLEDKGLHNPHFMILKNGQQWGPGPNKQN
jgi:L-ascorbate metabolism protein UlaG (beta-lactamase superfamily)